MAAGIFVAGSLPRLGDGLVRPAAAAVVAIWAAVALGFAVSAARPGGLARRTERGIDSFGIGTWVAGTAVCARALMLAMPGDPWPARAAFGLSVVLWLWFMPGAVGRLFGLLRSRLPPNGIILLSTVATQAIALIGLRLFSAAPAMSAAAAVLMALGLACYVPGAFLVVRRYAGGGWTLAEDWANGNCILHGALSITGLTAVVSGWFGAGAILALWSLVVAIFIAVEAIEIARLAARVRAAGLRRGLLVYDVSQWARNFTFGMFYAFTFAFAADYPLAGSPVLGALRGAVVAYGADVVLALLAIEAGLFLFGARAPIAARPAGAAGQPSPPCG